MAMFTRFCVSARLKNEIQSRLDILPFEITFRADESESAKLWIQSKSEKEFINGCLQGEICRFILNEKPFCNYEISEQLSIIQDFFEFIKI